MNNTENKSTISVVIHNSRTNPPLKPRSYIVRYGRVIRIHAEISVYRGSSHGLDTLVGVITGTGPIESMAFELGHALANRMADLVGDLPQIIWAEDARRMGSRMTMVMAAAVASLVKTGQLKLPFAINDLVPNVIYTAGSPRGDTISYLAQILSEGLIGKFNRYFRKG